MNKFLKFNLMIILIGTLMLTLVNVNASPKTGHEEFMDITFKYQTNAKLLIYMTNGEKNELMKGVKRRAFGWSTYTNVANALVLYEADTIFSRSNKTTQDIKFNYIATSTKSNEVSSTVTGTLALKASGKIDVISASLDASIRSEIGYIRETIFKEEMEFDVVVKAGKKISLVVKGEAVLSNGASKYYFLGICTSKKYWEYVDVVNEYYELYEEEA